MPEHHSIKARATKNDKKKWNRGQTVEATKSLHHYNDKCVVVYKCEFYVPHRIKE